MSFKAILNFNQSFKDYWRSLVTLTNTDYSYLLLFKDRNIGKNKGLTAS